MANPEINPNYHVPQFFLEAIEPYIRQNNPDVITNAGTLVTVWRQALEATQQYPEQAEHIAEWAMSAAASSPLLAQAEFDEIQALFGQAEDDTEENAKVWSALTQKINALSE